MEQTVHDHGRVELLQCVGGDLAVVNAARASFNSSRSCLGDGDERLIAYLMRERHGSPFEHAWFSWRIKAPLFVVREWQRHRTASYNEESGRYSTLSAEFYVPRGRVRTQVGRPGRYVFEPVDEQLDDEACRQLEASYDIAYRTYQDLLGRGVAREVARMSLPLATYSTMVWSLNARALMHWLSLRDSEQAQREIRDYARVIFGIFAYAMPCTADAFGATTLAP